VLIILCLLLAAGCSSLPDREEPERSTAVQAEKYARHGNELFARARFQEALQMYGYALRQYQRIDELGGAARAYNAAGDVYRALGRREEAERMYRRAYSLLVPEAEGGEPGEELDEEIAGEHPGALAETLGNLGETAYGRDKLEESLSYIERGLALTAGGDLPLERAVLLHNRGTVRKARGELDAAEDDLQKALELNQSERQYGEMATNHYMLGALAMERGEADGAREHLEQALALDKKIENSLGIAQDLRALAHICRRQGREDEAEQYQRRSQRVLRSIGMADTEPRQRP
jgi:tetratricopeptide (TPR) repeat protein